MYKEWGKYNNENSRVFLAVLTLLLVFFEIDRIPIKSYIGEKSWLKRGS